MTQRVFVDANILFSKTLMDWLFLLRRDNEGMFQTHVTEDVMAEVIANMREKNPRAPGRWTRRRVELIRENIDEVLDGFDGGLDFSGTDEHDYHVHAAAIASGADLILTANKPVDITITPDDEPYEIIGPDDFFMLVADSNPGCVLPIAREQIEHWSAKPEKCQIDDALLKAQCPAFAARVREAMRRMALS